MFASWGRLMWRRRVLVLIIGVASMALAGLFGTGVFARLQSAGGFTAPGSQSAIAAALAQRAFGRDAPDVVVLYSSKSMTVADPPYRAAVTQTLAALPRRDVVSAESYFSTGESRFVSADRRQTYAVIGLAGADDTQRTVSWNAIKDRLGARGLTVQAGGQIPFEQAANSAVKSDITRAEALSLPAVLILLTFIFGGLAAASLPLVAGGIGILGSLTVLRLLTLATPVSTYAVNITTILGLGLAIDYGLFMVARFREELSRQASVEDAVATTMATAGRTVAVSGVTVAAALASLTLFPETFLRSMGYGGVATVLVDMLAALTVMPALLGVLGPRVNALRVRRMPQIPPGAGQQGGGWYRLASAVMRRPVVFAAVILAVLLLAASPLLHVSWGGTDARVLPPGAQVRVVQQELSQDFPGNVTSPIEPVIQFGGPVAGSPARTAALAAYVARLAHVPGVQGAQVTGVHGGIVRADVRYAGVPDSAAARALVARIRALPPPAGARVYVGGQTAQIADELASIGGTLPWMAVVIAGVTMVLLFLAFGSVLLPVKAILMNVVSLSAMYGIVVWIFQDGHASGLLGFTPTGSIDPAMPILLLAIMFGLSTDYEVFLLSRVREQYDRSHDNTSAVAAGLQRTGGIITSAAFLLLVVIAAFSASGIAFIKLLGVGMIAALVIDASLVRVLLVPATMRLLGTANWWAPRPLRRFCARYGIRDPAPPGTAAGAAGRTGRPAGAATMSQP